MKLRPVFQVPWSGRPPPRAGRTAARFGAQLTARTARHPVCGEPFLPPNFRRRVAGVPPVRREALRVGCGFSFSRADVKTPEFRGSFSLKLLEHCQICASRRIKGGKLKAILKYISQNNKGDQNARSHLAKVPCQGTLPWWDPQGPPPPHLPWRRKSEVWW